MASRHLQTTVLQRARRSVSETTLQPWSIFLVTVTIVLFFELFRFTNYFPYWFQRCVSFNEGWFDPSEGWSVFALCVLAFTLLFLLNVGHLIQPGFLSDRTALSIACLNAIALVAIGVVVVAQVRTATIDFLEAQDSFKWLVTREIGGPGECVDAKPFLGRWALVSRNLGKGLERFPYAWIHFKQDLTYEAAHTPWTSDRELGFWRPPSSGVLVEPWLQAWTDAETSSWWLPRFESPDRLILELQDVAGHSGGIVRLQRVR